MKQEQVIELAEKHGATSYRNRADTANPAYGFTESKLAAMVAEVEQTTIERAAQTCEQSEACGSVFAARIRALKEDACE